MIHNMEKKHTIHCEHGFFLYFVHDIETLRQNAYLFCLVIED
jgi:hypothetical protein